MDTKNKIAIKLAIMLIGICALISCKVIVSPNMHGGDDYTYIKVLGYAYANPNYGDTISTIPSYSFKLPKDIVKWDDYDIGTTLIGLVDHQYIYIVYAPNDSLDYIGLIHNLENYLETSDNSLIKNIPHHIDIGRNNKRLNRLIRKDNFEIGILNVLPQNNKDLIKLIEDSFNIKY